MGQILVRPRLIAGDRMGLMTTTLMKHPVKHMMAVATAPPELLLEALATLVPRLPPEAYHQVFEGAVERVVYGIVFNRWHEAPTSVAEALCMCLDACGDGKADARHRLLQLLACKLESTDVSRKIQGHSVTL